MKYLLQKSLFCGGNKIEIDAEICGYLSELGFIRNLQTCQSENCSYFITAQCRCYGVWDEWLSFSCSDHLLRWAFL